MYRLSTFRDALRIIFRDNNVSHAGSYKVSACNPTSGNLILREIGLVVLFARSMLKESTVNI